MPPKFVKQSSTPIVQEETKLILDEFLLNHQASTHRPTRTASSPLKGRYQKVAQLKVIEERNDYNRTDSYNKSVENILNSDDGDPEERAHSLPSDFNNRIFHEETPIVSGREKTKRRGSKASRGSHGKVAYDSDEYTVGCLPRLHHSGTESSPDTDEGSDNLAGRRKKTLFQRTKERIRQSMRKTKNSKKLNRDEPGKDAIKQTRLLRKKKKVNKFSGNDLALNGTHEHITTHVQQRIHESEDHKGVIIIRTEETVEDVDIHLKKGSKKHIKKSFKSKESEQVPNGLIASFKRKRRDSKNKASNEISESKSAEPVQTHSEGPVHYERGSSVPATNSNKSVICSYRESDSGPTQDVTEIFREVISPDGHMGSGDRFNGIEYIDDVESDSDLTLVKADDSVRDVKRGNREAQSLLGLKLHRPKLPEAQSFDVYYEYDAVTSPTGDVKVMEHQDVILSDSLETDGKDDEVDCLASSLDIAPLAEKTQAEKEEIYEKVAKKLAAIADNYVSHVEQQSNPWLLDTAMGFLSTQKSPEGEDEEKLNSVERELVAHIRKKGDEFNQQIAFPNDAVLKLVQHATYSKFKDVVAETVGKKSGWKQMALVFYLSKTAISAVGTGGAIAMQIKDNTLKYFEDTFTSWIVGRGGWDSVLEDDSSDSELD